MNKQDIQTVLEVLANLHDKTSPVCFEAYGDSIDEAYANAHKAIAILTAALAEPEGEPSTVLRLIDTIKYLVGIAERGEGRKARDDELPEQFVLGYVKRLEAALAEPSEAVAEVAGDYNTKHIIFLPVGIALEVGDKLFTHPASKPEPSEADDTSCPTCGEDGGTSCGMPNCGLLIGESDVEPQNEPVAWQLGHRFYTSLKDAEYAWRNDCAFLGTSYVPEPLFTHPASKPLEFDKDLIQALTERDEYHDMADKLAEGIAACAETMRLTRPASKPEPLTDEEILLAISPFYKDTLTRRAAIEVSIDEYRAIEQAVISRIKP